MSPRGRPGFTLIELMIVVAIIGILGGAMTGLAASFRKVHLMNEAHAAIGRSAQTALYLLANDIRSAAAVEGDWQGLKNGERCLILRLPGVEAGSDRIAYYADPRDRKRLIKQVFAGPGSRRQSTRQVLCRDLDRLRFSVSQSPGGAKLVAYELAFASGYYQRMFREAFRGTAGMRNAPR